MTACYRQVGNCAVAHADEPGHIVQQDCSTTVEDWTFLFSFHISEHFEDQYVALLCKTCRQGHWCYWFSEHN